MSGEVVVVEGWIRSHSLAQAASECLAVPREAVLIVKSFTASTNKWESGRQYAEYIRDELLRLGVPEDRVFVIGAPVFGRDRTYHAALAARSWMEERNLLPAAIDVLTPGPHARRSRLLFSRAFGGRTRIGVVALDEAEYDPVHWWRSSEGVREVLFEGCAYLYAVLFFRPAA
jgi:uncharacterized SAM-binding protein YcdF (DUF218 family)